MDKVKYLSSLIKKEIMLEKGTFVVNKIIERCQSNIQQMAEICRVIFYSYFNNNFQNLLENFFHTQNNLKQNDQIKFFLNFPRTF